MSGSFQSNKVLKRMARDVEEEEPETNKPQKTKRQVLNMGMPRQAFAAPQNRLNI